MLLDQQLCVSVGSSGRKLASQTSGLPQQIILNKINISTETPLSVWSQNKLVDEDHITKNIYCTSEIDFVTKDNNNI